MLSYCGTLASLPMPPLSYSCSCPLVSRCLCGSRRSACCLLPWAARRGLGAEQRAWDGLDWQLLEALEADDVDLAWHHFFLAITRYGRLLAQVDGDQVRRGGRQVWRPRWARANYLGEDQTLAAARYTRRKRHLQHLLQLLGKTLRMQLFSVSVCSRTCGWAWKMALGRSQATC